MADPNVIEKDTEAVLDAAAQICGSRAQARTWFHHEPIDVFDYRTAEQLVADGRTAILCRYLQSLEAGFLG
ncbi:hypothetical protein HNO52_11385 [Billgrantia diversa]|uniref:hypothetical protein n=1 Tax=Halomonas sp. MCCC 1A13316 TaxID=2733487 RepID=UPI0018A50CAD|nr:hypothetical protein [Halomonas sp. MCCC 1A13316]QOR39052.1 hypothetical protein HNO52_11385 [Halomonas sp. MCCC 1A13316]